MSGAGATSGFSSRAGRTSSDRRPSKPLVAGSIPVSRSSWPPCARASPSPVSGTTGRASVEPADVGRESAQMSTPARRAWSWHRHLAGRIRESKRSRHGSKRSWPRPSRKRPRATAPGELGPWAGVASCASGRIPGVRFVKPRRRRRNARSSGARIYRQNVALSRCVGRAFPHGPRAQPSPRLARGTLGVSLSILPKTALIHIS